MRVLSLAIALSCISAFSAAIMSRSIGINNLALYSVAGASSNAAGDTIVLSTGAFPINIGEGDSGVIGGQSFIVLCRADSQTLALASPLASAASGARVTLSRAYASISAWEAAAPVDLVTADVVWKGVCYDDGAFIDQVKIQGSTTDSAHYKWLTVAEGQRHTGLFGTGARLKHSYADGSSWSAMNIFDDYFRIEWLELYGEGDRTGNGLAEMNAPSGATGAGAIFINHVMIHDVVFGASFNGSSTRLVTFANSVISHTMNHSFMGRSAATNTVRCYNSAVVYGPSPVSLGGFRYCYAKNCLAFNYGPGNGYANFMSCDPASDYNASGDNSAPGANSLKGLTATACLKRLVADSALDVHLAAASPVIGRGDSAGCSEYASDLDNEVRTSWDIGPDMYSTANHEKPPFTPWVAPDTAFLPAFPGCQGWGAVAIGGRGGSIIHVTNLNASGSGSFKAACEASGAKIIIFDVSGVIDLANVPINITSNTTVLGQTSPAGITLNNGGLYSAGQTNIIVRYIRVRRSADEPDGDCFRFGNGCSNIVIDHCSAMWCSDELVDISYNTRNITLCYTNLSEPGYCSNAYGSGSGMGNNRTAFLGGGVDGRVTLWRCVFSQAFGRVPCLTNYGAWSPAGKTFELINNVYYNCMASPESFYYDNSVPLNLVGNWYRGLNSTIHFGSAPPKMWVHASQNYHYPYPNSLNQSVQYAYISQTTVLGYKDSLIMPVKTTRITTAAEAFDTVIHTVGVLPWDSAEARTVTNIVNGTGSLVDFCDLPDTIDPFITDNPPKPADTDNDGIPDFWESSHGLNPNLATDARSDMGGYNAIEAYAHWLSDSLEQAAMAATIGNETRPLPAAGSAFSLAAQPNPFNGSTTFRAVLPSGQPGRLSVYDISGKKVASWDLAGKGRELAVRWDASSKIASTGIYYCRLEAGKRVLHLKVALIK